MSWDVRPGTEVMVKAEPGLRISGCVVRQDDVGMTDAEVRAVDPRSGHTFATHTASDGCFAFDGLPTAKFRIVASAAGFMPSEQWYVPGKKLKLVLSVPKTLHGQVLREGKPAPGLLVKLSGIVDRQTPSDASGRFSFKELTPGWYRARVVDGSWVGEAERWLKQGELPALLTVRLQPGGALEGTVSDELGPLSGASVRVHPDWQTTTDVQGHYRIGPLAERRYSVHASAPGHVPAYLSDDPSISFGKVTRADVMLRRVAGLSGSIVDSNQTPLSNATIDVYPDRASTSHDNGSVRTGSDGRFLVPVGPGRYVFLVQHPGFASVQLHVTAPSSNMRVVLPAGGGIAGVVSDEHGPVAGAKVVAWKAEGETPNLGFPETKTGPHGEFELRDLPQGRWIVRAESGVSQFGAAWRDGVPPAAPYRRVRGRVDVNAGTKVQLGLRFGTGPSIRGRVVDERGHPIAGAEVRAKASQAEGEAWSQPDGSFEIEDLEATQRYQVDAYRRGYPKRSSPRSATPGGEVELVLPSPAWVTGRVLGVGGEPLSNAVINEEPVADPKGDFRVPVGAGGEVTLHVVAAGYAAELRTTKAKPGEDTSVGAVELTHGRPLQGVVVDADTGAPVSTGQVFLNARRFADSFTADDEAVIEENGRFRLGRVGEVQTLTVHVPGYEWSETPLRDWREPLTLRVHRARAPAQAQ